MLWVFATQRNRPTLDASRLSWTVVVVLQLATEELDVYLWSTPCASTWYDSTSFCTHTTTTTNWGRRCGLILSISCHASFILTTAFNALSSQTLVQNATKDQLDTLSELALNLLSGVIPLEANHYNSPKRHAQKLRALAQKKGSMKRTKQLLVRGGFYLSWWRWLRPPITPYARTRRTNASSSPKQIC